MGADPVNRTDSSGLWCCNPLNVLKKIPRPSLGCLTEMVGTGLEILTMVPGPIGVAAGVTGLGLKCVTAGCGVRDFVETGIGFVPGAKAMTKVNKALTGTGRLRAAGRVVRDAGQAGYDMYDANSTYSGYVSLAGQGVGYGGDALSYL